MRPVARRFRLEMAGRVVVGLAFDGGDAEMEEWLCAREVTIVDAPPSAPAPLAEPAGRGQPSAKAVVVEAFRSLTLADFHGCATATAVAERVRSRVASMAGHSLSTRCVRDHLGDGAGAILAQLTDGKNDGKKCGKNSGAATTAARGER